MADELARTAVSMAPETYLKGKQNAKKRGFNNSFSAYVAWLIEKDDEGAVERERIREAGKTPPGAG